MSVEARTGRNSVDIYTDLDKFIVKMAQAKVASEQNNFEQLSSLASELVQLLTTLIKDGEVIFSIDWNDNVVKSMIFEAEGADGAHKPLEGLDHDQLVGQLYANINSVSE